MAGRNFLVSLPVLLVWLAGLAWCVVNWRKAPRASIFALIGLVIFFLNAFLLRGERGNQLVYRQMVAEQFFVGLFFSQFLKLAGFSYRICVPDFSNLGAEKNACD
jgi:hypothetical protein